MKGRVVAIWVDGPGRGGRGLREEGVNIFVFYIFFQFSHESVWKAGLYKISRDLFICRILVMVVRNDTY